MRLFRSKGSSRKNSEDSTTSIESDQIGPRKLRRGSAPVSSKPIEAKVRPTLATIPSQEVVTKNKLVKKPTKAFPVIDISNVYERDKQTGEQKVDHTDLLHSLINDEISSTTQQFGLLTHHDGGLPIPGDVLRDQLSDKIWNQIFEQIELADKVSLSYSCHAFRRLLRSNEHILRLPENHAQLIEFLQRLDKSLPNHVLCYICTKYHLRLLPGQEMLKPTNIANPIYNCPQITNPKKRVSRTRLTSGRALTFTFAQLLHRYHKLSPLHGVSVDALSRRYRDTNAQNTGWTHLTRFCIVNGRLLLRITSTTFAAAGLPPAGLRNLLYNPAEEFHPYFSTCPHWRDGELMPLVKCAISHIPKPLEGSGIKRVGQNVQQHYTYRNPIVTLCQDCRPMRRCPECPTEYLIEIKMAEDKKEPDPTKTFKQALVVTRWSDLGDGTSPWNPEWAACAGELEGYDSLEAIGKRAVSGIFESYFTAETIPGQRMLNLNPKGEKKGEAGHNWY